MNEGAGGGVGLRMEGCRNEGGGIGGLGWRSGGVGWRDEGGVVEGLCKRGLRLEGWRDKVSESEGVEGGGWRGEGWRGRMEG